MNNGESRLRFENFEVHPDSGELYKAGVKIRIQDQPFKVLVLLLRCSQQVVTREDLKAHIWPNDSFGDFDHGVNRAIAKLRVALGDSPETPRYVETIPRRGYRFLVPLNSDGHPEPTAESLSLPIPPVAPEQRAGRSSARLYAGLAFVGIVALAAIILLMKANRQLAPAATPLQDARVTRITSDGDITSAVISPDGRSVAYGTIKNGKASLRIRQISGANSIEIASSNANFLNLAYAPDGNSIFYRQYDAKNEGFVFQIPAFGGTPRRVSGDVDGAPTISPDGKQLAFIRHAPDKDMSQIIVGNTDGSGEKALLTTKYPVVVDSPAWSKDGKRLACTHRVGLLSNVVDLIDVDAATGRQSATLLQGWHGIAQIAWNEHSDGLVFVAQDETGFGRGQIFYMSYPKGTPRKITSGVDLYDGISISGDARRLASVLERWESNIWLAPEHDLAHPKPFTSGTANSYGALGVSAGSDGRLVFSSQANGSGTLWAGEMSTGATQQLLATPGEDRNPWVMPDGSVVFSSARSSGDYRIWHADRDGGNPRQLTAGPDDRFPVATPDGRWIFYQSSTKGQSLIMKIPVEGGQPQQVSDILSGPPGISPDGKTVAYGCAKRDGLSICVQTLDSGHPVRLLPVSPTSEAANDSVVWGRDGKSIQYFAEAGGVPYLWSQSISGGGPKELARYASEHIFAFAWSPDHKTLVLAKGRVTRDIVVIDEQK